MADPKTSKGDAVASEHSLSGELQKMGSTAEEKLRYIELLRRANKDLIKKGTDLETTVTDLRAQLDEMKARASKTEGVDDSALDDIRDELDVLLAGITALERDIESAGGRIHDLEEGGGEVGAASEEAGDNSEAEEVGEPSAAASTTSPEESKAGGEDLEGRVKALKAELKEQYDALADRLDDLLSNYEKVLRVNRNFENRRTSLASKDWISVADSVGKMTSPDEGEALRGRIRELKEKIDALERDIIAQAAHDASSEELGDLFIGALFGSSVEEMAEGSSDAHFTEVRKITGQKIDYNNETGLLSSADNSELRVSLRAGKSVPEVLRADESSKGGARIKGFAYGQLRGTPRLAYFEDGSVSVWAYEGESGTEKTKVFARRVEDTKDIKKIFDLIHEAVDFVTEHYATDPDKKKAGGADTDDEEAEKTVFRTGAFVFDTGSGSARLERGKGKEADISVKGEKPFVHVEDDGSFSFSYPHFAGSPRLRLRVLTAKGGELRRRLECYTTMSGEDEGKPFFSRSRLDKDQDVLVALEEAVKMITKKVDAVSAGEGEERATADRARTAPVFDAGVFQRDDQVDWTNPAGKTERYQIVSAIEEDSDEVTLRRLSDGGEIVVRGEEMKTMRLAEAEEGETTPDEKIEKAEEAPRRSLDALWRGQKYRYKTQEFDRRGFKNVEYGVVVEDIDEINQLIRVTYTDAGGKTKSLILEKRQWSVPEVLSGPDPSSPERSAEAAASVTLRNTASSEEKIDPILSLEQRLKRAISDLKFIMESNQSPENRRRDLVRFQDAHEQLKGKDENFRKTISFAFKVLDVLKDDRKADGTEVLWMDKQAEAKRMLAGDERAQIDNDAIRACVERLWWIIRNEVDTEKIRTAINNNVLVRGAKLEKEMFGIERPEPVLERETSKESKIDNWLILAGRREDIVRTTAGYIARGIVSLDYVECADAESIVSVLAKDSLPQRFVDVDIKTEDIVPRLHAMMEAGAFPIERVAGLAQGQEFALAFKKGRGDREHLVTSARGTLADLDLGVGTRACKLTQDIHLPPKKGSDPAAEGTVLRTGYLYKFGIQEISIDPSGEIIITSDKRIKNTGEFRTFILRFAEGLEDLAVAEERETLTPAEMAEALEVFQRAAENGISYERAGKTVMILEVTTEPGAIVLDVYDVNSGVLATVHAADREGILERKAAIEAAEAGRQPELSAEQIRETYDVFKIKSDLDIMGVRERVKGSFEKAGKDDYKDPESGFGEAKLVVFGDMHGSALKVLESAILSKAASMPPEAAREFRTIYVRLVELASPMALATKDAPNEHSPFETAEKKEEFKKLHEKALALLGTVQWIAGEDKQLMFIGDMVSDRGLSDGLTFKILSKLRAHSGSDVRMLASNHDLDLLFSWSGFSGLDVSGADDEQISKIRFASLGDDKKDLAIRYMDHFRSLSLIEYDKASGVLFAHGPITEDQIQRLKVTAGFTEDLNPGNMPDFVRTVNTWYKLVVESVAKKEPDKNAIKLINEIVWERRGYSDETSVPLQGLAKRVVHGHGAEGYYTQKEVAGIIIHNLDNGHRKASGLPKGELADDWQDPKFFLLRADETDLTEEAAPEVEVFDEAAKAAMERAGEEEETDPAELAEQQRLALSAVFSEICVPGGANKLRRGKGGYLEYNSGTDTEEKWTSLHVDPLIFDDARTIAIADHFGIDKDKNKRRDFFSTPWALWLAENGLGYKPEEGKKKKPDDAAKSPEAKIEEQKAALFQVLSENFAPGTVLRRNDEDNYLEINTPDAEGKESWSQINTHAQVFEHADIRRVVSEQDISESQFWLFWREWLKSVDLIKARTREAKAEVKKKSPEAIKAVLFAVFDRVFSPGKKIKRDEDTGELMIRRRVGGGRASWVRLQADAHVIKQRNVQDLITLHRVTPDEFDALWKEWLAANDLSAKAGAKDAGGAAAGTTKDSTTPEGRKRAAALAWFEEEILRKADLSLGSDGATLMRKRGKETKYRAFHPEEFKTWFKNMKHRLAGLRAEIHSGELEALFDEWFAGLDRSGLKRLTEDQEEKPIAPDAKTDAGREAIIRKDAFDWFNAGLLPELALGHDGVSIVRKRSGWTDYKKFDSERYKKNFAKSGTKPKGLTSDIHKEELARFFDEWWAALDKDALPKLAENKEPSNLTDKMREAIMDWLYDDKGFMAQLSRKEDGTIMRRQDDGTVDEFKPEGFKGWLLKVKKPLRGLVGTPAETANGAACVEVFETWWENLDKDALPLFEAKAGDKVPDEVETADEGEGTVPDTVSEGEATALDTESDTEVDEEIKVAKKTEIGKGRYRLEYSNGDVYQGRLDAEGHPHGQGFYILPKGLMYQGNFDHGLKHGKFILRRSDGAQEILGYEEWEQGVVKDPLDIAEGTDGAGEAAVIVAEGEGTTEPKEYKVHGRKEILPGDLIELIGPDKLRGLMELFVSADEQSVQDAFRDVFDEAGEGDNRLLEALRARGAFDSIAEFRDWWKGEAHEKLFQALQFELYAQIEREVAADTELRQVEEKKSGWRSFFDGLKDFGARIAGGAAGGAGVVAAVGGAAAFKSVAGAAAVLSGPAGLAVAGVAAIAGIITSRIVRRHTLHAHEERKLSGKRAKEVEAARLKAIEGVFERIRNPKTEGRDELVAGHLSVVLNELLNAREDGRSGLGAEALHVRATRVIAERATLRAARRDSSDQEEIDARGKRAEHLIAALDFRNNRRRENAVLQTRSARVAGNLTLMQELGHELKRGNISNLWIDDPSRAKRWTGTAVEGAMAATTLMAVTAGGAAGALTGLKKLGLGLVRFGFGYARGHLERGAQLKAEDIETNKKRIIKEMRELLTEARKRLREVQKDPSKIYTVAMDISRLIFFLNFDEANPKERIFAGNEQLRGEISVFLREAKAEQRMYMLEEEARRANAFKVQELYELEEKKVAEVRSDKERAAIARRSGLIRGAMMAGVGAAFDFGMSWVKERFLGESEAGKPVEETSKPKAGRQAAVEEPAARPRAAIETEIPGVDKPLFDFDHPTDPALAAKLNALKAANPEAYDRFGELVKDMWSLDEKEVGQLLDLADLNKGEGVEHRLIAQLKFLDKTLEGEDREVFNRLIGFKPGGRVDMETLIEREAHRIALRERYAGADRVVRYPLFRKDVEQNYLLGVDGNKFSMDYAQRGGDHLLEGSRYRSSTPAAEPVPEAKPEVPAPEDAAAPSKAGAEIPLPEQEAAFVRDFVGQINGAVGPEHELRLNPDLIQYARPGAFSGSPVESARIASGGGGVEITFEDGTKQVFKPVFNHPTESVVLRPVPATHAEAPVRSGGGGPEVAEPRAATAKPAQGVGRGEVTRFSGKPVVNPDSVAVHDMSDQVPPTRLESVERAIEDLPWNPDDKALAHNYALHMDWQDRMFADGSKSLETMVVDAGFADPGKQRVSGWIGDTSADILSRLASARHALEDGIAAEQPFSRVMAEVQKHHLFTGDDIADLGVKVDDTPANFTAYKQLILDQLKQDYRARVEPQMDLDSVSDPRLGGR